MVSGTIGKIKEPFSRLYFIDNWRIVLISLVLLHHVAVIYGAVTPFYYVEPPMTNPLAFLIFLVFALFNQSWFMGAFFLLSGYFTPGSYDRKGAGTFLKDRLLRLGIPLVIFTFVLGPVSYIGLWQMPPELTGITAPLSWQAYPKLIGIGPLWFVAMLLIFDFGYAGWRKLNGNRATDSASESSSPSYISTGLFVIGLAVSSYLLRMIVPMGKEVWGFPTLAYLPQYLSLFVIGTVAARRKWFQNLPGSKGVAGFIIATVAGVLLFPLAFSGRLFSVEITPALANFAGNGYWQSAVYALWDSVFAVGICMGLVTLFRRILNGQNSLGRLLSQHSYAVYLIHVPILVFIAVVFKGVGLTPLLKFGIVAVTGLPVCFTIAWLVRKVPFVSRIL